MKLKTFVCVWFFWVKCPLILFLQSIVCFYNQLSISGTLTEENLSKTIFFLAECCVWEIKKIWFCKVFGLLLNGQSNVSLFEKCLRQRKSVWNNVWKVYGLLIWEIVWTESISAFGKDYIVQAVTNNIFIQTILEKKMMLITLNFSSEYIYQLIFVNACVGATLHFCLCFYKTFQNEEILRDSVAYMNWRLTEMIFVCFKCKEGNLSTTTIRDYEVFDDDFFNNLKKILIQYFFGF